MLKQKRLSIHLFTAIVLVVEAILFSLQAGFVFTTKVVRVNADNTRETFSIKVMGFPLFYKYDEEEYAKVQELRDLPIDSLGRIVCDHATGIPLKNPKEIIWYPINIVPDEAFILWNLIITILVLTATGVLCEWRIRRGIC